MGKVELLKALISTLLSILIATALLSLAIEAFSTYMHSRIYSYVEILPTRLLATALCNSTAISNWASIGNASIDPNLWGLLEKASNIKGFTVMKVNESGILEVKSNLDLTSITELNKWNVIGYHEVIYGIKPWGTPHDHPAPNLAVPLPIKASDAPRMLAFIEYSIEEYSTGINMAFDIWLTKTKPPSSLGKGDLEVMVWLFNGGLDFTPKPVGVKIGEIEVPVIIDREQRNVTFEAWVEPQVSWGGWTYVAFVSRTPLRSASILIDLTMFIDEAILRANSLAGVSASNGLYIASIELGTEVFYSPIVRVKWALNRYVLISIPRNADLASLLPEVIEDVVKSYYTRLILWITPWGEIIRPVEFPNKYVPGVVIAYDVYCSLCTSTLMNWLTLSISYIKEFRSRNLPVFINLFCEKYVPQWQWRGQLMEVTLDSIVLEKMTEVIGNGEYTYIGFSEMTECIKSTQCRGSLVEAYSKLREAFPKAKLYYYGSGSEEVDDLVDLFKRAGLDYIGIDLWDYEPVGDGIRVKQYLIDKLRSIESKIGSSNLVIGEIGLRIDDSEAYVEPWNKNRAIVRCEEADSKYYKSLLTQLLKLEDIIPAFIGIWSWNDDSFALKDESDVLNVLELFLQTPMPLHELSLTTTTIPRTTLRDSTCITALLIAASAAIAAYIALRKRTYINKLS